MADDKYLGLPKRETVIATDHDVVIRVIEEEEVETAEGKKMMPKEIHDFKVNRQRLIGVCDYFKSLFGGKFKEGQQSLVELHGDSHQAIKIWLCIFEGNKEQLKLTYSDSTFFDVWQTLLSAHKYDLDAQSADAKAWFAAWYEANLTQGFTYEDHQQLLFPCYTFDHARGFAAATKFLAYHGGHHVVEQRPDGFKHNHLRMDQHIMQQVNAARGRLRTILHTGLYSPIERLLQGSERDCKKETLYAYEKALHNTGAWPLEKQRLSIHAIMEKLDRFQSPNKSIKCSCGDCFSISKAVVTEAISKTKGYFDGLCLDCMDVSKPKLGDPKDADEDYWRHDEQHQWDKGCRIKHGQPSWYFSFLGRREKMREHENKKRSRYH